MHCTLYSVLTNGLSETNIELEYDLMQCSYLLCGYYLCQLLVVLFLHHFFTCCQNSHIPAIVLLLLSEENLTSEIEYLIFLAPAVILQLNSFKSCLHLFTATTTLPLYLLHNTSIIQQNLFLHLSEGKNHQVYCCLIFWYFSLYCVQAIYSEKQKQF